MWPYWLMLLVPVWGALTSRHLPRGQALLMWWLVGIFFTLMIGLRHEVGGDWLNYLPQLKYASTLTFSEAADQGDPGYFVLNWLVAQMGGSIYTVNLACAVMLMSGTIVFCRRQPKPWLALLAAVPYMLIVVGMGYTRQAAALGFILLGLVALGAHRARTFVTYVFLAALFHKSAILLLPIAALATSRNRILTAAMVIASTGLLYYQLLDTSVERLWTTYVTADMQSGGGPVRVLMNSVPALLMIMFGKRLVSDPQQRKLWLWLSVFALVCVPLVFISSTAVDRVALYLIPLQLFVAARLGLLAHTTKRRSAVLLCIVAYYVAVQFVWLNFATHAPWWVPYHFMPLT